MKPPSGICEECAATQRESWVGQFWLYCPHSRILARRPAADHEWTVDLGVSPDRARRHIAAALGKMEALAKARGLTLAQAFENIQTVYEFDREAARTEETT